MRRPTGAGSHADLLKLTLHTVKDDRVLTLVPGWRTGMFLSVRCSVTFDQLRQNRRNRQNGWRAAPTSPVKGKLLPALVGVDLLLNQMSVGVLCLPLGHLHQLDQLGPEHTDDNRKAGNISQYV